MPKKTQKFFPSHKAPNFIRSVSPIRKPRPLLHPLPFLPSLSAVPPAMHTLTGTQLLPSASAHRRPLLPFISPHRPTRFSARVLCSAGENKQQQQRRAYPFDEIEPKWQRFWEVNKTFRTPEEVDTSKPKYYILDMFPYPRYHFCKILKFVGNI